MGTFAENANYCLSFADQGKQIFIFRFFLQETKRSLLIPLFAANKRKLPFSVSSVFVFIYMLPFQYMYRVGQSIVDCFLRPTAVAIGVCEWKD
jgi:putative effector of murein hydrolase